MVVATQNPIEQQGTYPLPEAQLDRFLFKAIIDYPARDEERAIVARHGHRSAMPRLGDFGVNAGRRRRTLLASVRGAVAQIRLSDALVDYIVDVIRATREHRSIEIGASPRAANMLAAAARAYAALAGPRLRHPRRHQDARAAACCATGSRCRPAPRSRALTADRISARFSTRRRRRESGDR